MEVKRVLITGVSGFLGKNMVTYFRGVKNLKLFGHSRTPEKAALQFTGCDITFIPKTDAQALDDHKIDCIIHLAGIAHDLNNKFNSADYFRVNDANTREFYGEFLKSKAAKFIFLSSIKAAVDISLSPVTEEVVCNPVTPYGRSKRLAEEFILAQPVPNSKKYYILRPCMIHGPGNKGNLNLLYKFVKSGLPYPLGSFYNQRSFLSVDNLNFIIDQLIKHDVNSGIYHLADEGYLSTTELYSLIAQASERKARVWNITAGFINFMFTLGLKQRMLHKLTENMMVSNQKIKENIEGPLPVDLKEGIVKTIKSFRES